MALQSLFMVLFLNTKRISRISVDLPVCYKLRNLINKCYFIDYTFTLKF